MVVDAFEELVECVIVEDVVVPVVGVGADDGGDGHIGWKRCHV